MSAQTGPSFTTARGSCRNCANAVSDRFRRVFGDENGRVHCCPNCAGPEALQNGGAADPDRLQDNGPGEGVSIKPEYRGPSAGMAIYGGWS